MVIHGWPLPMTHHILRYATERHAVYLKHPNGWQQCCPAGLHAKVIYHDCCLYVDRSTPSTRSRRGSQAQCWQVMLRGRGK